MIKKAIYILVCFAVGMAIQGCVDEIYNPTDPGTGNTDVDMTVAFEPLTGTGATVGQGRSTDGNAISDINDLALIVYRQDGSLYRIIDSGEMYNYTVSQKDTQGANTSMPDDVSADRQAEKTTSRATFTLRNFEVGRYYIYAVANMGIKNTPTNADKYASAQLLRTQLLEWNPNNIASNNQMFGYATLGTTGNVTEALEAPLVSISRTANNLHAWLKRAASKVTVVFDGSGLKDNIRIYVNSVTIKDIPRYCYLGMDNRIGSKDSLINVGESIYYNTDGVIEDGRPAGTDWSKWMIVSRGAGKKGAVKGPDGSDQLHSEYAKSLFFYENKQGNHEGNKYYSKEPVWENVGWVPEEGDYDYKDNKLYGTYIEVDAYYVSQNLENVTQGPIKYRFMLGQNTTYDYNASRNHHYKVTLGFRGYANQPDWHIVYEEKAPEIYTVHTYYVSYQYNRRSEFPVRIVGDVDEVEFEIVENNWAPYDETQTDKVAEETVPSQTPTEPEFTWNKKVYLNNDGNNYYYGLKSPRSSDGTKDVSYAADKALGAPDKVTAIWAGFLALTAPGDSRADIPTNLFHSDDGYWYSTNPDNLKKYYYGNGGDGIYQNDTPQNYRKFDKEKLNFPNWSEGQQITKTVTTPNNAHNNDCEITKSPDGSITINLPLWTRPKILYSISGFSGSNPYDAYRRKAIIRITASYKGGEKVVKYMPVYQVRRVVNPAGVWRSHDDNSPFHVRMVRREGMRDLNFHEFPSEGAWRAYIKDGDKSFISLRGGIGKDADGAIIGATDSPVDFYIDFNQKINRNESRCAVVMIEYHGYTCQHPILVRQGFNEPLAILDGGTKWSSYSLFKCTATPTFGTTWNASSKNYIDAQLTASPLALGTLFKRGNYRGILVLNNSKLGHNVSPGTTFFSLSDGSTSTWGNLSGNLESSYAWGRFKTIINGEERHYRVPTLDDFEQLLNPVCEFNIGVLYSGTATGVAMNVNDAYGFEDYENNGDDSGTDGQTRGMRGIFVYNGVNANQVFFALGARGVGRRTIQSASGNELGVLRYGAVKTPLTGTTNAYRPIPYNMPGAPGAIYWINTVKNSYTSWDMNYFDLNFNAYGGEVVLSPNGDALPIKLVLDED